MDRSRRTLISIFAVVLTAANVVAFLLGEITVEQGMYLHLGWVATLLAIITMEVGRDDETAR